MTPDEKKRLADVEKQLKALSDRTAIPLEVERAFRSRLKALTASTNATGTFTAISRTINLTGNAQSISVLEDPAGYISVLFNNQTYKVPYWID